MQTIEILDIECVLRHVIGVQNENQNALKKAVSSYRHQEEIKLFDQSLVQLPLDKQMQYQHNNIDVNRWLVYTR